MRTSRRRAPETARPRDRAQRDAAPTGFSWEDPCPEHQRRQDDDVCREHEERRVPHPAEEPDTDREPPQPDRHDPGRYHEHRDRCHVDPEQIDLRESHARPVKKTVCSASASVIARTLARARTAPGRTARRWSSRSKHTVARGTSPRANAVSARSTSDTTPSAAPTLRRWTIAT